MTEPSLPQESIFLQALEVTPAERAAFLDRACAGDRALRADVEGLLRAHDRSGGLLDIPETRIAGTGEPEQDRPGGTVDGYRLLQQIGEGGMGTVFVAEQTDPVHRKVAIKIVKPGMDSRQVVARFRAERQALALMDHPNIARVLDAGTTAGGRPYFVMELVNGVPITRYCDDRRLTPRQRLGLFADVCRAVQHAHQKGVIHRDLKPSNVLVAPQDDRAVPKIIDFGVAKAVGQRLTEETLFTQVGQVVGTLEYMSPEQARLDNQDIDTRSDIYGLGVLLYELLTGTTPLESKRLKDGPILEVLRLIREEEPPKPSTRLSTTEGLPTIAAQRQMEPTNLTKQVRGELDWIVMKALEKDRARRYETANELARDIGRYLDGEAVLAAPPSASYRLRKFARKHRAALATTVAIALFLVAGVAVSTWQAVRATRAKQLAQARLGQIEKANDVLASVFRDLDPRAEERGGPGLQEQLSQRVLDAARELDGEAVGDPPTVARLQHTLGSTLKQLGHYRQAVGLLEKACATRNDLLGPDHPDTLASTHDLGDAYTRDGQFDRAVPLLEQTLEGRTASLGTDHPDTLGTAHALAQAYHLGGQQSRALELMRQTVEKKTATIGPDHPGTLNSLNDLALAYHDAGQPARAVELLGPILEKQKATIGPDHPHTLNSMNNLGLACRSAGQLKKAQSLHEESLEKTRARLGSDHPLTLTAMANLAETYRVAGQLDKAVPLYEQTLAKFKEKLRPDHPRTLAVMNNLAVAYGNAGRRDVAVPLYKQTLERRTATLGPDHPDTLTTMSNLAVAYAGDAKPEPSVPLFEKVFQRRKAKLGLDHPATLDAMANLGAAYRQTNRLAEAIPLFEEAVDRSGKLPGGLPLSLYWVAPALATMYDEAGQFAKAEPLYRRVLERNEKQFGPEHVRTANALAGLGHNLLRQQYYAESENVLRRCLAIRDTKLRDDWQTFNTRSLLGGALSGQEKHAEAEPLLLQGYEGMKQRRGKIPPPLKKNLTEAVERLVALYEATGNKGEAARWRKELEGK
jgi:serine/threonine protein kinase/lipopolysaccharide biosynthesis regulator YciM